MPCGNPRCVTPTVCRTSCRTFFCVLLFRLRFQSHWGSSSGHQNIEFDGDITTSPSPHVFTTILIFGDKLLYHTAPRCHTVLSPSPGTRLPHATFDPCIHVCSCACTCVCGGTCISRPHIRCSYVVLITLVLISHFPYVCRTLDSWTWTRQTYRR